MNVTVKTKKVLLIVGGAGIAASIITIFVNKAAKNKVLSQINGILGTAQANNTLGKVKKERADLSAKGEDPSFPDIQFSSWVTDLVQCFSGWAYCSNFLDVFKQLQNDADVYALIDAFGTQSISSGKWNIFEADDKGDLVKIITDSLNPSDLQLLNQTLADNGISYTF